MSKWTRAKIVGLVSLVGGLVVAGLGVHDVGMEARLKQEGVTVPARVLEHETVNGRRGKKVYRILVEYRPEEGGEAIRGKFTVGKEKYEATAAGEPVNVRYLRSDPSFSRIEGIEDVGAVKFLVGVMIALFGALYSTGVFVYAFFRKRNARAAEPTATTATRPA